jgi:epoxyqueuosine reductase QueG
MARNAALVLGNRRDARSRDALVGAAEGDACEGVREAARWALERLLEADELVP